MSNFLGALWEKLKNASGHNMGLKHQTYDSEFETMRRELIGNLSKPTMIA
jgi:hypothetical protein